MEPGPNPGSTSGFGLDGRSDSNDVLGPTMQTTRDLERPPEPAAGEAPLDGAGAAAPSGLSYSALARPTEVRERPHRRRGLGRWLRALEHTSSHLLARHVYPAIPGIHRPYARALRQGPIVSTAEVDLPGLPLAFDGLQILLVTDIHAGPFVSRETLAATFSHLRRIPADLILIGGDLATARVDDLDDLTPGLCQLEAPLGRYAVLGNHDHATGDPAGITRRIEACGIECLHNRSVELRLGSAELSLAGIDDLRRGRPELDRALSGTRPPVVLLSHHPDVAFDAARRGVALVLSGHTHGGQIVLPGLPQLVRQSRHGFDAGRYRALATEVVVSRGLGVVGLPLRIGCPAEVVALTLRRDAGRGCT